jgi:pimeloyl-ACP methyl ester carboxylesterase
MPIAGISPPTGDGAEERWVSVDGLRMRYLQAGSGPPLVLVHGLLGYSFSWRFNLSALARQATVYAPDLPGAGFSERSANMDCSMAGCAARLTHFLDRLGIANCDLLGTSHGGAIAMMVAERVRVRRLILVAPVNPWSRHGRQVAIGLSLPVISGLFARCFPHMRFANGWVVRRLYGDPGRISPGTVDGYSKPLQIHGSFEYPLNILRTWTHDLDSLRSIIPRIAAVPTLLVWGSEDRAVDPRSAEILRGHFQRCRLAILDGVGHLPYEEAPNEFNNIVMNFLAD